MSATPTRADRSYHQFCPVAAGLDVLGDRWVLLIVRELLFADRRWAQLRRALPGLSPNLLSERLTGLQERGIVVKTDDDAPYSLTEKGRSAGPILGALARFGADFLDFDHPDVTDPQTVDARRTAKVLLMAWIRPKSAPLRARIVVPDGSSVDVVVDGRASRLSDPEAEPDVTVHTDIAQLANARRGQPFAGEIDGSAADQDRFLRTFALVS